MERHKSEASGSKKLESDLEKVRESRLEKEDTALPPTLQHLVYFWEELEGSVLKVR
jgi:hypothetical protein